MQQKDFIYQADWFSEQIPWWEENLAQFKGKQNLHFLEIGSFEGRSAIWLLENILTAPNSSITCVDTFGGSPEHEHQDVEITKIEQHFRYNIQQSGFADKVTTLKGYSRDILPTLPKKAFDCIYIDGSHKASDVLEDAVLSKLLLKQKGVIIFDDYIWEDGATDQDKPTLAIDAFLKVYEGQYSLLYKGKQIIIQFVQE